MAAAQPMPEPARASVSTPRMIQIPAGSFAMGCDAGQDCERPVHRVLIDAFEMAVTQVTNAEYGEFLRATGRTVPPLWEDPDFNHPRQPVVTVSWFDAADYCAWLAESTGRHFRLPTEAEWERAARGKVEGALYPWGDSTPQERPGYSQRWKTGPERLALDIPNSFGLYDVCANVHEWCSDWYDANYYAVSPERNPRGPDTGTRRSSRGGSWRHHIKMSRCAARSSIPPEFQYADYGFRVACDLESRKSD
jgi:formylglycine-generating enzyme required for sulfatase activity